jgi:hypothetical protein
MKDYNYNGYYHYTNQIDNRYQNYCNHLHYTGIPKLLGSCQQDNLKQELMSSKRCKVQVDCLGITTRNTQSKSQYGLRFLQRLL